MCWQKLMITCAYMCCSHPLTHVGNLYPPRLTQSGVSEPSLVGRKVAAPASSNGGRSLDELGREALSDCCIGSRLRPVLSLFLPFYERTQMCGVSLIWSPRRLYLQGVCICDL